MISDSLIRQFASEFGSGSIDQLRRFVEAKSGLCCTNQQITNALTHISSANDHSCGATPAGWLPRR